MRVRKIAKNDYYLRHVHLCPSVRPSAWSNSAPTGRIFMKFDMRVFFETRSRKFKFHQYLTRITGSLCEDLRSFSTISRLIILTMRNVSDKRGRGNQNTHFMFNNVFLENCAVYEMVWKNVVGPDRL